MLRIYTFMMYNSSKQH